MAHAVLAIDPARCEHDLLAVGEVLLRLSPPRGERFADATRLALHVGGAEFNVAFALAGLGQRAVWAGSLPRDHPGTGRVRNHARSVGLTLRALGGAVYDGYGRRGRLGWNLVESGTGERAAYSWYDRGHTGSCVLGSEQAGECPPPGSVAVLHTGGTFAGLGEGPRALVSELVAQHARAGAFVCYDLNWRSRMWTHAEAVAFARALLPHLSLLVAGPRDLRGLVGDASLGIEAACARLGARHPGLRAICIPVRREHSATVQDWSARMWWSPSGAVLEGPSYQELPIEERIGGGDAFLAGVLDGILGEEPAEQCLALGVHLGALGMATPGDTARVTAGELRARARSGPPSPSRS